MTEEKATTLKSLEKRVNGLEDELRLVTSIALAALRSQRYAEPQALADAFENELANAKRSQS